MPNSSPNYEALLAQDDWLRRIARGLVRDPDLADDLVQDAWVASLERGRGGEEARPWLIGVVRNAGARVFRTADRQRDRAQRRARENETTARATDDVVADLQLRERLTHELRSLEEPFRFAVYQRFVTGLSLKELAQLTDVSVSTASERVHRGLALLRQRMDMAHGGDRGAWVTAILPLAMPKIHATSAKGALAIGAAAKTAFAVAAAGTALFLAQRWTGEGEHPATPLAKIERGTDVPQGARPETQPMEVRLATEPPAERGIVAHPLQQAEQVAETTAASPRRVLHVIGRVNVPKGTHSRRARWSLGHSASAVAPGGGAFMAFPMPVSVDGREYGWTDWDGELDASFNMVDATSVTLVLKANDCVSLTWTWSQDEFDRTIDIGTVTLELGGRITGSLVDQDGQPLADMQYTVRAGRAGLAARASGANPGVMDEEAISDPLTGRFELRGIPAGLTRLTASGMNVGAIEARTVSVEAGETTNVDLTAADAHAAATAIVVTFSPGLYRLAPVPDPRTLRLVAPDGSSRTPTRDSSNAFRLRFEQVGAGAHILEFDDSRHGFSYRPWLLEDVHAGGELQAGLFGRSTMILDLPGGFVEPPETYSLELEALTDTVTPRSIALTVWRGSSGGDRIFTGPTFVGGRLVNVIPGGYLVTVRYGDRSASAKVEGLGPQEKRVVHLIPRQRSFVSGRVVHTDGAPAGGVTVRLVEPARVDDSIRSLILSSSARESDLRRFRVTRKHATTGPDGAFFIDVPGAGRYIIVAGEVDGPLAESEALEIVESARAIEGIEVVLPRGARVRGRVDAPADVDLWGWRILVIHPDGDVHAAMRAPTAVLGPDHRFVLQRLAPGRVELYLSPPTTTRSTRPCSAPPGGRLLASFEIAAGETLERTFPFTGSLPASLTIVADVMGLDGGLVEVRMFPLGKLAEPTVLDGLLPTLGPAFVDAGTYDVVLVGDGWAHAVSRRITVAEGGSARVSVDVPLVSKSVRITDEGRVLSHQGVTVESIKDSHATKTSLRTDATGEVMVRLAAGTYRLVAPSSKAGGQPRTAEFRWPLLESAPVIALGER